VEPFDDAQAHGPQHLGEPATLAGQRGLMLGLATLGFAVNF
jgi:hypothetical protein